MVVQSAIKGRVLDRVAKVYERLDSQIRRRSELAGVCGGCGRCCNFAEFDHRLFVTTPELMYLAAHLGGGNIKPTSNARCPYNVGDRCTIYKYRFAGCRIFCCKGDRGFQSGLSEWAVSEFKSLCAECGLGYRYSELAAALNGFGGD